MKIQLTQSEINAIVAIVISVISSCGGIMGSILAWFKLHGKNSPKAQAILMWIEDISKKLQECEVDMNHVEVSTEAHKVIMDKLAKLKNDYNAKVNEYNVLCRKKVLDTKLV